MHNSSDQQIGQLTQRTTELDIEPLPAGVGRDFGCQTGQKTAQRLGPVALQGEDVLELVYDSLDDLGVSRPPNVGRIASTLCWNCPWELLLPEHQVLHPMALP